MPRPRLQHPVTVIAGVNAHIRAAVRRNPPIVVGRRNAFGKRGELIVGKRFDRARCARLTLTRHGPVHQVSDAQDKKSCTHFFTPL